MTIAELSARARAYRARIYRGAFARPGLTDWLEFVVTWLAVLFVAGGAVAVIARLAR